MGFVPTRIEVMNEISGVEFNACHDRRIETEIDGLIVSMIGLDDLLANKRASGRGKDLIDVDNLTG